jgi:hypothetical protein
MASPLNADCYLLLFVIVIIRRTSLSLRHFFVSFCISVLQSWSHLLPHVLNFYYCTRTELEIGDDVSLKNPKIKSHILFGYRTINRYKKYPVYYDAVYYWP